MIFKSKQNKFEGDLKVIKKLYPTESVKYL